MRYGTKRRGAGLPFSSGFDLKPNLVYQCRFGFGERHRNPWLGAGVKPTAQRDVSADSCWDWYDTVLA